jgi:hypothetical protein
MSTTKGLINQAGSAPRVNHVHRNGIRFTFLQTHDSRRWWSSSAYKGAGLLIGIGLPLDGKWLGRSQKIKLAAFAL